MMRIFNFLDTQSKLGESLDFFRQHKGGIAKNQMSQAQVVERLTGRPQQEFHHVPR